MPVATRKQIRDSVLSTTHQSVSQIGSLVEEFINLTMQEIGDPGWAYRKERHHLWSWLKRKTTFTATSEDTVLERDIDKIAVLRQLDSPVVLEFIADRDFYRYWANPTAAGNPRWYRLWEITGLATALAAADTIDVVSSSTSDDSSFTVTVQGYVSGRLQTETYTLNGTTTVTGSTSFDAREIFVSKSANTTGNITVSRNTGGTTLVVIGPQEISPRFKVLSLYPIPSSNLMYLEYYKRIKELNTDGEMPEFDPKWHNVVRIGTLAKTYQYLGKIESFGATQQIYSKAVRSMVASDQTSSDAINYLKSRNVKFRTGVRLHLSEDVII